ncbi:GtrA family protein [Ruegeria conchae]|uniref:Putative flippase GtrA n=1 Tax=Ruegeria conchae TaxID=981384 RepID=A0A497ZWI2_9RHOB|nr:GtrA family protein [Ruegeria conchae]RLK07367.1 putative flippase GtrA [Ruegeria conchae]
MSRKRHEFLRYGATVALGLIVDLAAARSVLAIGVPIELAAVIGVAFGAIFNFVVLDLWAFAGQKAIGSGSRRLRYLGALGVTMAVRAAAVWVLAALLPAQTAPMVILCLAVGVSFTANFLLSKHWVFQRDDQPQSTSGE